MTDFEKNLKEFFPELFELHLLAKGEESGGGGEAHILDIVEWLNEMHRSRSTGKIYITYSKGKIDSIRVEKDVLAFKKNAVAIDNQSQT